MKNKETSVTVDLLKMAKTLYDTLLERIEMVGMMANPDMGKKILDARDAEKAKAKNAEAGGSGDDLLDFAMSLEGIPEVLSVEVEQPTEEQKFFLPKYHRKRKLGIEIDKKAGD
jgi:hypothetical protein